MRQAGTSSRLRTAQVTDVYLTAQGVPVCDVVDSNGNVYLACRLAGPGGGGDKERAFVHIPPAEPSEPSRTSPEDTVGAEAVIAFGDGAIPHPVVIGTLYNSQAGARLAADVEPVEDDVDFPDVPDVRDLVMSSGGARLVLSRHGDAVLSTKDSTRPLRLELNKGNFLRISQEDDADEGLVLAGPLIDHLGDLVDKLDSIGNRLSALETAMGAAMLAGDAVITATPALAATSLPYTAFSKSLIAALGFTYTPPSKAGDEVIAAAVQVSSQTKSAVEDS